MNNNQIISALSGTVHKIGFKLMKHSPEILLVSGIVGVVTSAVMACKSTTKISSILEKTKEDVDAVHSVLEDDIHSSENYSEEDSKKDLAIIYVQTGLKFIKLYTPAIIIGGLSITAILSSNNILKKRNVALAAAYATVEGSFKDYRNRVIDRFGEKIDKELKYDIKAKTIEEITTDENGNEVRTEKTVDVVGSHSMYSKFFDECSTYWSSTPDYNQMYLISRQNYANNLLQANGYLFLNDVYDMLDIPKTKEGQIVGWTKDTKNGGDGYVDFGIFKTNKAARQFVNGYEKSILLDFNVDGNILDLM